MVYCPPSLLSVRPPGFQQSGGDSRLVRAMLPPPPCPKSPAVGGKPPLNLKGGFPQLDCRRHGIEASFVNCQSCGVGGCPKLLRAALLGLPPLPLP